MDIIAVSNWRYNNSKERLVFAHAFVVDDAVADTIEDVLNRICMLKEEIELSIKVIRSYGW